MFILNQEGDTIVNVDNVSRIVVDGYRNANNWNITANTIDNDEIDLGEYASEERAKKELQNILQWLKAKSMGLMIDITYEMPEE